MKQIIQDLKNGNTILEEVPAPQVSNGKVLIKTTRSLVSLGTERMLVEFGKASLIEKASKSRAQKNPLELIREHQLSTQQELETEANTKTTPIENSIFNR